jgi:DNA adenine methylase
VFWAKPREVSRSEILNDADGELVNFYLELHRHGRRLVRELDGMPYSRALFNRVKADRPRGRFARARRFWYLNRVGFGAKRRGETFGVGKAKRMAVLPPTILDNLDATIERLRGVVFEAVDVCRLIDLYDSRRTCFFIDPPYWGTSQDYAVQFPEADHARLVACLGRVRGTWLLTYNDVPQVRHAYAVHHVAALASRYTAGCNAGHGQAGDEGKQLLISNRPFLNPPTS